MAWYAGVDLGATNIKAVVGDDAGLVVDRTRRRTPRGPDGDAVSEAVVETLADAVADANLTPGDIAGIGVGSFGPLDTASGAVQHPANLPETVEGIPLVGPLRERFDADIRLHNDAVAGVIGERFYADSTPADMAYLTISSGIGAGVTVDGVVLSGWDGNAAEVGHTVVEPDGLRCGCGVCGHWEAYCSGNNIPQHARHIYESETPSVETDLDLSSVTARDVYEAARTDPLASATVEQCARYNALGVANLIHAYAPLVVYVGGAVARHNPEQVVEPLRERVPELVMANVPDIRPTTLGDEAVVRGALASALTAGTGDRAKLRA